MYQIHLNDSLGCIKNYLNMLCRIIMGINKKENLIKLNVLPINSMFPNDNFILQYITYQRNNSGKWFVYPDFIMTF